MTPVVFASNALLVFIVVAAFLSLDSYEKSLLKSLEHALSQQARFMAAWLGTERLGPASARSAIDALGRAHTARIRIIGADGSLLADSSLDPALSPNAAPQTAGQAEIDRLGEGPESAPLPETSLVYRIFSLPVRLAKRWFLPPQAGLENADAISGPDGRILTQEVRAALAGSYGSATRISSGGQVSVTLYCAVPVPGPGNSVAGAVLLSQSTYRILADLYKLRAQVGGVFLWGLGAAMLLTAVLSLLMTRPLRSLARQAREAMRPGAAPSAPHFRQPGPGAEVGDLYAALAEYSARLRSRVDWAERFSQDAAHELRNPIAAIGAAAEYLEGLPPLEAEGESAAARIRSISAEAKRMDRIVKGLRGLSRLDSGPGDSRPVAPYPIAANVVERLDATPGPAFRLEGDAAARRALVAIDPDRFATAVETIAENARSFSPIEEEILITARAEVGFFSLMVADRGPGIPEEHLGRIFERFFTYRPGDASGEAHSGLGLSIAAAIAQAAGGRVEAANRPGGGAVFAIVLPLAGARPGKGRKADLISP
jgi:two-component system sensor histidine kinase ChvG